MGVVAGVSLDPVREALLAQAEAEAEGLVGRAEDRAAAQVAQAEEQKAALVRRARAEGEAARFKAIYEEYAKAPEVTRQRLYIETMERVLGGIDKIILGGQAGAITKRANSVIDFGRDNVRDVFSFANNTYIFPISFIIRSIGRIDL